MNNQNETNFENISNPKQSIFSLKTFSDLPINSYLIKTLSKSNYITMTKIQKKSIPLLLSHKNLIIKSETGTGKTLAYLIPVYEYLININNEKKISRKNGIFCIIFSPTHELCLQIENCLNKLKDSCINVVYGTLMGGQKIDKEKKKLRKGVNILVSTPGRLLYHLKNTKNLNFENLKFLIFDEADLMLSMGFEKEIKECFKEMFKKGENNNYNEEVELNADLFKNYKIFLVSATVDGRIRKMADYLMKGFKAVGFENENKNINNNDNNNKINDNKNDNENNNENNDKITYNITNNLNQFYCNINDEFRLISLIAFLYNNISKKIIIFSSCCDSVNFLYSIMTQIKYDKNYTTQNSFINNNNNKNKLNINYNNNKSLNFLFNNQTTIFKLHGKMSHDERSEIFMNFNKSTNSFLICTDVASRGLDFMNIDWVIHYDINPDVKEYINRMGRTARLDKGGNSLMFVMNNENEIIDDFNKKINNNNNCINEILCSEILLKFLDNFNKNLKNKIEIKSLNFEDEIDENEKFRKEFFYVIAPIKKMIKDFIFENKENLILARKGFKSWVRAYGNNNKFYRNIFNVKKLNLTRISRSFGLYKESMKIKVNGNEMNVDYEFEKKNVKMDKKIFNKKIQKKIMFSEFEN